MFSDGLFKTKTALTGILTTLAGIIAAAQEFLDGKADLETSAGLILIGLISIFGRDAALKLQQQIEDLRRYRVPQVDQVTSDGEVG